MNAMLKWELSYLPWEDRAKCKEREHLLKDKDKMASYLS